MDTALIRRSTASTSQNSQSSRSHAVFIINVHGDNADDGQNIVGTMYLVDLAGSERLSKSQVSGETLKETQFINKSLSALGDVFGAIATKSSHVPYRNSKLTYLLQSALSGFHRTLMVCLMKFKLIIFSLIYSLFM
jgi:kinesin family protein C1